MRAHQLAKASAAGSIHTGRRYVLSDTRCGALVGVNAQKVSGHVGRILAGETVPDAGLFDDGSTVFVDGSRMLLASSGACTAIGSGAVVLSTLAPATMTADHTVTADATYIAVDTTAGPVTISVPSTLAIGKAATVVWTGGANPVPIAGAGLDVVDFDGMLKPLITLPALATAVTLVRGESPFSAHLGVKI